MAAKNFDGPVQDDILPAQWMSLREALDALESRYGYVAAKDNLLELIADARIKLRCPRPQQLMDFGRPNRFGHINVPLHEGDDSAQPLLTSKTFFNRADKWRIDPERVDWQLGTITATRPAKMKIERESGEADHLDRLVARNVMVERDRSYFPVSADLTKGDQATQTPPATKSSAKKGGKRGTTGPRIKLYDYPAVMKPLFAMIKTGEIEKFGKLGVRGTQAKIGRHIRHMLTVHSGKEPSPWVYGKCARKVMAAWRAHVAASDAR